MAGAQPSRVRPSDFHHPVYISIPAQSGDGYASDNLDEPDEEPAPKKRKQSKAAAAKQKEKEKAKAKKKGKKGDDDDYEDDEDEDPYSALSKMWKNDLPKPPVGSFEDCARCEKQFTVVRPLASNACIRPALLHHAYADQVYHGREPSAGVVVPYMREVLWC